MVNIIVNVLFLKIFWNILVPVVFIIFGTGMQHNEWLENTLEVYVCVPLNYKIFWEYTFNFPDFYFCFRNKAKHQALEASMALKKPSKLVESL